MKLFVCPVCLADMNDSGSFGTPVVCSSCGKRVMPDPKESRPMNPYQSPLTEEIAPSEDASATILSYRLQKRRLLMWMVVLYAVFGFAGGLFRPTPTIQSLISLGMAVASSVIIVSWCAHDRVERQVGQWRFFTPLMVVFPGPLVMVPVYLCVTRGKRGLVSTALAAAFLVVLIVVAVVAYLAAALFRGFVTRW